MPKDSAKKIAEEILKLLAEQNATLAVAESCTGGLVAKTITDIPGASAQFLGGVVSYANSVKKTLLGVKVETLEKFGAVSKETAQEMALGVRAALCATYGLSLTGISGPSGGSKAKPVGTLYVALSGPYGTKVEHHITKNGQGSRIRNRAIASQLALDMLRLNLIAKGGAKK